jgi:hypothetical protein
MPKKKAPVVDTVLTRSTLGQFRGESRHDDKGDLTEAIVFRRDSRLALLNEEEAFDLLAVLEGILGTAL